MSKKMIRALESDLADKMRDKGKKETKSEGAEYGPPAAFLKKLKKKKRGR